jgi:N-carbamoylputrescine amidase
LDHDDCRGHPDFRVERGYLNKGASRRVSRLLCVSVCVCSEIANLLQNLSISLCDVQREMDRPMASDKNYRVGLIQMSCSPDPDANLDKAADRVREAAHEGAQVICLPELFRAQYFCQREDIGLFDLAEPIPGPSTERLSAVAHEEKVVVIASLFERRAAGLYHNTAAVLEQDGSISGLYRKMHIPDDPLYYEKFYFTPGDLGFRAFDTSAGKIGTLVCWDQWYPEGARLTALQGANVLFYPTAIGWHPAEKAEFGETQYSAWQTIQRAHAIANGVFVAAVNRVGHENGDVRGNRVEGPGLEFWGGSFLADPFGRVIAKAAHDKEEILIGEIDLRLLEDTRRNWPFLRDRRIDAYGPIVRRFLDEDRSGSSGSGKE